MTRSIVSLVRDGTLDTELAALLWQLADAGVAIHLAAPDAADAQAAGEALGWSAVSVGEGASLEDVLRQPVPLRPATGAVLILDGTRLVAAHLLRPPLRDAGGHIRPQGPAVLAAWDENAGTWEHFAWGVTPELAAQTSRRAGDFEIEQRARFEFLEALVASSVDDDARVRSAMAAYAPRAGPRQ